MRFVFSPPAEEAAGLLSLPWTEPLEDWTDERLVEIRQRGISRHVVRFVADDGALYALKEINERLARGKRPDVDTLAALVDWAGLKADDYVVRVHQNEPVNPLAMISTYFKGDCNLTPEAAAALEKVVKATYEALRQS